MALGDLLLLDQKIMSPALRLASETLYPSAYWLREVLASFSPAPWKNAYSIRPEQSKPTVWESLIPLGLQQIPLVAPW